MDNLEIIISGHPQTKNVNGEKKTVSTAICIDAQTKEIGIALLTSPSLETIYFQSVEKPTIIAIWRAWQLLIKVPVVNDDTLATVCQLMTSPEESAQEVENSIRNIKSSGPNPDFLDLTRTILNRHGIIPDWDELQREIDRGTIHPTADFCIQMTNLHYGF